MSDLSWLNPTPHAIAVYASRPLSPVAAQHSLPSGRYSLLGPDFHRLDRTSLRLAHSFDHLVGAAEQWQRHSDAERRGGLEVQEHLNFCGLLYWQLARLFAFENAGGVDAGQTVSVGNAAGIPHQAAGCHELPVFIDRRHRVADSQRGQLLAPAREECIGADHEPARSQLDKACEDSIEVTFGAGIQDMKVQPEGMRCRLRGACNGLGESDVGRVD